MLEVLRLTATAATLDDQSIARVLAYARRHLRMQAAWISRAVAGQELIEFLDGDTARFGLQLGCSPSSELSARVVTGELPRVVADLAREPRAFGISASERMGVSAQVSVPMVLPSGQLYGMLACVSQQPQFGLADRDSEFLELVAALLTPSLIERDCDRDERARIGARIQTLLDHGGPDIAFQQIYQVPSQQLFALEARSRFPDGYGDPAGWFADADRVGLRAELEIAAVRAALTIVPDDNEVTLSVKLSPDTIANTLLQELLTEHRGPVIVEISRPSDTINIISRLRAARENLRQLGCLAALENSTAEHIGLQHLVDVSPDIVKLPRTLVRDIDIDAARRAMASAMTAYAHATGTAVIAEGIETAEQLTTVVNLGVDHAQGHYLGHPTQATQPRPSLR
jgi:EAL domain-containing protein (putative c-di-GMP-specific phosphodiesterase class I)